MEELMITAENLWTAGKFQEETIITSRNEGYNHFDV